MAKELQFGQDAQNSIIRGVNKLAEAVVSTLGPKGANATIQRKWGSPLVVHDGVTVAREIDLSDPWEDMGAQLVKEAASKTNDSSGDGTTSATLLAQIIINLGFREIKSGHNAMILKNGLEKASKLVIEEIEKQSQEMKTDEEITKIASISAQSEKLGEFITEAFAKVGADGLITVEEAPGLETEITYKEGMEFDRGYISYHFVSNSQKSECELKDVLVLVTDKKLISQDEIVPLLEIVHKAKKSLLIIADNVENNALGVIIVNKLKGNINSLAVRAPEFGDRRKDLLDDIAVLTGATVISDATGVNLESVTLEDLGQADRVWADSDWTRIIGGRGDKKKIEARIDLLRAQLANAKTPFVTEKVENRLAKLASGVAVISVGASSETELREKKERVIDAVAATKAAVAEGIVPGGGVALLHARKVLKRLITQLKGDEAVGANLLYQALSEPLRRIVRNAGAEDGFILQTIENKKKPIGYDVMQMKFVNVLDAGIIDPTKVTKSVVRNSVSVAMMALTTAVLIIDKEEKE